MPFFYKHKLPNAGDLVVANIVRINPQTGAFCTLPEYNDLEAFLNLKEISRYRFKKLKGVIEEGTNEVMEVVTVDKGYVDLSRKFIKDEERELHYATFSNYQKLFKVLHYNFPLIEQTYIEQIVWDPNFDFESFTENVQSELLEAHTKIIRLFNQEEQPTVHQCTIVIYGLLDTSLSASQISSFLVMCCEEVPVVITTCNVKLGRYTISNKVPLLRCDFDSIVSQIQNKQFDKPSYDNATTVIQPPQNIGHQPLVNIGIVGHVAHGKTTLIEAITGCDTRRHKRELETNRTLNLGYTNADITKCVCDEKTVYKTNSNCDCEKRRISIVDCPGHHVLLSTMLVGARIMDTAMIVVAANSTCPQPQTKEHVQAIEIISQGTPRFNDSIVIQNKIDLVQKEEALTNLAQVKEFLNGSPFEDALIYPMSAQKKLGLDVVLEFMYNAAETYSSRTGGPEDVNYGIIVRSFDVNKPGSTTVFGCVIGGSVLSGQFTLGDEIVVVPLGLCTRIVSIKTGNDNLLSAKCGGLIAFGTDLSPVVASQLVGCTFIKKQDYDPEKVVKEDSELRLRYYLLGDTTLTRLRKDTNIVLNVNGLDVPAVVCKSAKESLRCTITVKKALYLYNTQNMAILVEGRLVGFCRLSGTKNIAIECGFQYRKTESEYDYVNTLDKLYEQVHIAHSHKEKIVLPFPEVIYKNTYTTIVNFDRIASALNIVPSILGQYIFIEIGARKFSINGQNQLILKGRINAQQFTKVLSSYTRSIKCENCGSLDTQVHRILRVKQQVCDKCGWKKSIM
jgi:translation initiation factor 2 subunit 3